MECQRLNKMIRSWYVQVQDETLAPARMVEFMEQHIENCDECLIDPGIQDELKKIIAIVLPVSKMTKPPKRATKVLAEMPTRKDLEGIKDEDDDGEVDDEDDDDVDDVDDDDDDVEVDDDDDVDVDVEVDDIEVDDDDLD